MYWVDKVFVKKKGKNRTVTLPGYTDDISDETGVLGVHQVAVLIGHEGVDVAQFVHQLARTEDGK